MNERNLRAIQVVSYLVLASWLLYDAYRDSQSGYPGLLKFVLLGALVWASHKEKSILTSHAHADSPKANGQA